MCGRADNQEVGLEAAILERVRNSSLVKWSCADNVAGLKHTAEAADLRRAPSLLSSFVGVVGQGPWVVGERPAPGEASE